MSALSADANRRPAFETEEIGAQGRRFDDYLLPRTRPQRHPLAIGLNPDRPVGHFDAIASCTGFGCGDDRRFDAFDLVFVIAAENTEIREGKAEETATRLLDRFPVRKGDLPRLIGDRKRGDLAIEAGKPFRRISDIPARIELVDLSRPRRRRFVLCRRRSSGDAGESSKNRDDPR
ncbi:hypothetical protein [Sphingopyxis terrae]|uniref:hypothetical protein n=1 Tax=Sphingopyxis terrae TaxID=33052 RepID=UPI002A0C3DDC|nr:hypothetical protein [Sphingopyxis terrae]MDX8357196.1 hypothetical protein [Sphingopyxis terrae]